MAQTRRSQMPPRQHDPKQQPEEVSSHSSLLRGSRTEVYSFVCGGGGEWGGVGEGQAAGTVVALIFRIRCFYMKEGELRLKCHAVTNRAGRKHGDQGFGSDVTPG